MSATAHCAAGEDMRARNKVKRHGAQTDRKRIPNAFQTDEIADLRQLNGSNACRDFFTLVQVRRGNGNAEGAALSRV
jgi:hypothetical protein